MLDQSLARELQPMPARAFKARAAAVLGPDFAACMAAALMCSLVRFNNPKGPQPAVAAIVELLELLAARGVAAEALPRRWRAGAIESWANCTGPAVIASLEASFGSAAALPRLSSALGVTMRTVTDRLYGGARSVRPSSLAELAAIAELVELALDTGPEGELPRRWRATLPLPSMPRQCAHGAEIEARARAVLGDAATARLARAVGRSERYLAELTRDGGAKIQPGIVALVELLEVLQAEGIPSERWPARWHLTEGGA